MRWIAIVTAACAALCLPATASAADLTTVQGNALTYTAGDAEVDTVTIADAAQGKLTVSETTSPGGAPGTGCTVSSPGSLLCNSANSVTAWTLDLDDTITLSAHVIGFLDGGTGNDTVTGGPYNDNVKGSDGNDVLDGRFGWDWIYGGAGDDRIEARDGLLDIVDCGAGDDRANADSFDSLKDCEVAATAVGPGPVVEPPVDDQPPVVTQPLDPERAKDAGAEAPGRPKADKPLVPLPLAILQAVGVTTPVAQVSSDGTAAIEMACAATETAGCRGVVYLDPAPAVSRSLKSKAKAKGKPRAIMARRGRFGRGPFVIASGKRGKASVKLTPEARRALGLSSSPKKAKASRRGRRVRAKVTVVQKGKKATRAVVELRG